MCRFLAAVGVLLVSGCTGEITGSATTIVGDPGGSQPPADAADAGATLPPADAPGRTDGGQADGAGIAPIGIVVGEINGEVGDNSVQLGPVGSIYRVDAEAGDHIAFVLTFPSGTPGVTLAASRWDGAAPVPIGTTDAGAGLRVLSVLDAEASRTFWVRVRADAATTGTLTITRTAFEDGSRCSADCDRLLQMPLPNDPTVDGYDTDGGTVFRYWFGRRDLVMIVRHLAHLRALAGESPVYPYDFSQWDGQTPGTDVGAPRHASHQRGKDVDVSLSGTDGLAVWRSFCTTEPVSGGRQCVPGTRMGLDTVLSSEEIAGAYVSGRVTMCFLDRELIAGVIPGAMSAVSAGIFDPELLPLFSDGRHLQHWPNHDNHVHIRVSETAYNSLARDDEPFEAP